MRPQLQTFIVGMAKLNSLFNFLEHEVCLLTTLVTPFRTARAHAVPPEARLGVHIESAPLLLSPMTTALECLPAAGCHTLTRPHFRHDLEPYDGMVAELYDAPPRGRQVAITFDAHADLARPREKGLHCWLSKWPHTDVTIIASQRHASSDKYHSAALR